MRIQTVKFHFAFYYYFLSGMRGLNIISALLKSPASIIYFEILSVKMHNKKEPKTLYVSFEIQESNTNKTIRTHSTHIMKDRRKKDIKFSYGLTLFKNKTHINIKYYEDCEYVKQTECFAQVNIGMEKIPENDWLNLKETRKKIDACEQISSIFLDSEIEGNKQKVELFYRIFLLDWSSYCFMNDIESIETEELVGYIAELNVLKYYSIAISREYIPYPAVFI
ncbi:LOW QUALITY PROTEIN: hypothetical protein HZS_2058 [Henneguya salminicola]|nr:LOW QUALITY PROTEIN: hypothetical protein HZS_2058 [Henneguya salminicola]